MTPIEELIERIEDVFGKNFMPLNEQTKFLEKEKKVIIEAYQQGRNNNCFFKENEEYKERAKQYYNETFK